MIIKTNHIDRIYDNYVIQNNNKGAPWERGV